MLNVFLIFFTLMAFGVIHSLLASHPAKQFAQRLLGRNVATATYRLVFNVLAFATILPALSLVFRLPDRELYRLPAPWDAIALGLQMLAALGLVYSLYQMDVWFFLGVRQLGEPPQMGVHYSIDSTSTPQLVTNGLHRFVRHPLYTTSLMALYLTSPMSLNWLAFAVSCHVYFFAGSIFEERKLVREFGDAYRAYQQHVPRLLPRPWRLFKTWQAS
jgi:protein-S-isoprenylcysteine O-methyltransferase Ste14